VPYTGRLLVQRSYAGKAYSDRLAQLHNRMHKKIIQSHFYHKDVRKIRLDNFLYLYGYVAMLMRCFNIAFSYYLSSSSVFHQSALVSKRRCIKAEAQTLA